jgi:hypothetical protein
MGEVLETTEYTRERADPIIIINWSYVDYLGLYILLLYYLQYILLLFLFCLFSMYIYLKCRDFRGVQ